MEVSELVPVVVVGSFVELGDDGDVLGRLGQPLDSPEGVGEGEDGGLAVEVDSVVEELAVEQEVGVLRDVRLGGSRLVQVGSDLLENCGDERKVDGGGVILLLAEASHESGLALAIFSQVFRVRGVNPVAGSLSRRPAVLVRHAGTLVQETLGQNSLPDLGLARRVYVDDLFQVLQERREALEVGPALVGGQISKSSEFLSQSSLRVGDSLNQNATSSSVGNYTVSHIKSNLDGRICCDQRSLDGEFSVR